ncbi:MAG: ATP-binding protein [Mycoplasmatales bacterium]|nr:ATP-binding protein [Mycoplasmatales bacterium]
MSDKYDSILKKLLENEKISKKVNALKLTKKQMIEAIPILIDMSEEIDDGIRKTLTSFELHENGSVKRISVLAKRGLKYRYLNNVVTNKMYPVNFEDDKKFIYEEGRKEIVNLFANFLNGEEPPKKGLYLHGQIGIGKTFIMKRFAKKLAENDKKIGFINLSKLTSILKGTFGSDNDEYLEIFRTLTKVEYLFIDDIGAEKITTWFRDDFLFSLLNERMEHERITFFSSNYSHDNLLKKQAITSGTNYRDYDNANRLISRIKALSISVLIKGKNKR